MPFAATWVKIEIIILSQTVKDKYHMISFISGILKNDSNELIYKTETDSWTQKANLQLLKEKVGGEG